MLICKCALFRAVSLPEWRSAAPAHHRAESGWCPYLEANERLHVIEIIILAMIAAFLGLRLYSVLGRRAEQEEEPVPTRFDAPEKQAPRALQPRPAPPGKPVAASEAPDLMPAVERGVAEIAAADRTFDLSAFLDGARGAYAMVLEAFWNGDKETLRELCDADVYESFEAAIDAREAAGEKLENKLIRIEESTVHSAELDGGMARIAVLFVADIAAVTRNADGQVIAGSLDDAIESRDIWTFSRDVRSDVPAWLVDETDQG